MNFLKDYGDKETILNIIGELGNISVGGAASSLSDFVKKLVTISVPDVKLQTFEEIKDQFEPSVVFAEINYQGGLSGVNILLLKKEEALDFSKIILKEKLDKEVEEWNAETREVVEELFNIMVGRMSSSLSDMLKTSITVTPPMIKEEGIRDICLYDNSEQLIAVWFEMRVESVYKIKLLQIIDEQQAIKMIKYLMEGNEF